MKFVLLLSTALVLAAPAVRAEDALVTAQDAYFAAWDAAPMAVQYATLVTESVSSFGEYTVRADNVYKPGQHLVTYIEPVGFGYKTVDSNTTTFGFTVDVSIADADGKVEYAQNALWHPTWSARLALHEAYLSLDIGFDSSPFPAGDYVVTYTLHDDNSAETVGLTEAVKFTN